MVSMKSVSSVLSYLQARDSKMLGHLQKAQHYGTVALILNIVSTVLLWGCVIFLVIRLYAAMIAIMVVLIQYYRNY